MKNYRKGSTKNRQWRSRLRKWLPSSERVKKNKFVNSVKFIDDKLTLNIDKFAKIKIKKKIHYNIAISNPSIRENIFELAEFKGTKKILEFK